MKLLMLLKKSVKIGLKKICPDRVFLQYKKRKCFEAFMEQFHTEYFDEIVDASNSNFEMFEQQFQMLRGQYGKIIVERYYMRHIGEMCLTLYFFLLEKIVDSKNLYVFLPIYYDMKKKKSPNQTFFKWIKRYCVIIDNKNASFWWYCMQRHRKELIFDIRYDWDEMIKRNMCFSSQIYKPEKWCDFSVEEKRIASDFVRQWGITQKYVCFFNRDESYYQDVLGESTNNYIEHIRNTSVSKYISMAEKLLARGISSVRMGSRVKERVNGLGILDYANKARMELMDFYLIYNCEFFITAGSGIQCIATLFFKPQVLVDYPVISFGGDLVSPLSPKRDLMILKKLWYPTEQRFLSIREMLTMEQKYASYELFREYQKMGIVFQENTSSEITDVALEMYNRLNGTMVYTKEDELLQEKYRKILMKSVLASGNNYYDARIGAKYLRENPWLLS